MKVEVEENQDKIILAKDAQLGILYKEVESDKYYIVVQYTSYYKKGHDHYENIYLIEIKTGEVVTNPYLRLTLFEGTLKLTN